MKLCAHPGCGVLLPIGVTRCDAHSRKPWAHTRSRQARGYDAEYDRLRLVVLREEWACHWCGRPKAADDQVDHLIPLARGGQNVRENLARSCPRCNARRNRRRA